MRRTLLPLSALIVAFVAAAAMPAEAKFTKKAPAAAGFTMPKSIKPQAKNPKVTLASGNSLGITDPYQFVPLPQAPKAKKSHS